MTEDSRNIRSKLYQYITDPWNVLDVITILMFIAGLILRFTPMCTGCFEAGRILLALDIVPFILRVLHISYINKQLGPKLIMIGRMVGYA